MDGIRVPMFLRSHGGAFIANAGTPIQDMVALNARKIGGSSRVMVYTSSRRLERFDDSLPVKWRYIPHPKKMLEELEFPFDQYEVDDYIPLVEREIPALMSTVISGRRKEDVEVDRIIEAIESMGIAIAVDDDDTLNVYGLRDAHKAFVPSIMSVVLGNKQKYVDRLRSNICHSISRFTSRLKS